MKVREYEKHIWLITYASGSKDMTPDMLHNAGVKCDECYTITWRESKYTLIHLNSVNRMRMTPMNKAMNLLKADHGIISNAIAGYEVLSCNDQNEELISQHPGFKRLVELLNTNSAEIRSWLEKGDLLTYRKGLLWKYIESTDLKKMTHGQLVDKIKKLESFARENTDLKEANQTLQAALDAETTRSNRYFQKLMEQKDECHELRMRLVALNADATWTKPQ